MELMQVIKKPEMRRIFGERELEIIEKQLMGIRLTPSEITRLSRDIRKKFMAVQMLNNTSIFSLKKGSELKRKIEEVKQKILENRYFPKIKKIVLYGSSAYGIRTFRSDIDIAVEFDTIEKKDAFNFIVGLGFDKKVQVEVYNLLPDKIKKEIDERGKIIYERKS
ncbi:MAG: nucleotidyltransferase domain-containing protein [Nanoarchaeota archaeon]